MLGRGARDAITRLAESALAVDPLVRGLGGTVEVAADLRAAVAVSGGPADPGPARDNALGALVERVARGTGTGLLLSDRAFDELGLFERVVSARLHLDMSVPVVPADRLGEVETLARQVRADGFARRYRRRVIVGRDGMPLVAYSGGEGDEVVVLVPACGMPASLSETWLDFLARDRTVLTWESRGLFGDVSDPDTYAADVPAQVGDLLAVLDGHGAASAHVVGLCGGAVIALAAAALHPARVRSVSLWHGAYGFAEECPTTSHQRGIIDLMLSAARSRDAARAVHAAFGQAMLTGTPGDVAHLVLYPYATPELLFRYCRLNTGITGTHVEQYLPEVRQPVLVVTSRTDDIASPEGSRRVADGLTDGRLRIEDSGDHISLFSAGDDLLSAAAEFMSSHSVPA